MIMKTYAPRSPGRRQMTGINYREFLTRREPEKSLVAGIQRAVGRNNLGRITTRHKGGGAKRLLRLVDFKFDKKDIPARVESVEYDPNRTAFIGLVVYRDGEKRYIVLPKEVRPGREILVSEKAPILPGNRLPLGALPPGTFIYNIALSSEGKAVLVRSAGSFAEIVAHDGGYATIKLPSGEFRKVKDDAWASIGQVSNEENNLVVIGKAGRSRLMGIRPTVRGSAMNPVDHPYGGGEGRTLRGTRRPKNKWGRGTRGVKTRNPNKYSSKFIISRRTKN
ncbi:50S ribosomal protein L2 [Candidatus Giovannonibacteria bacterium RIFCSPLOWO2_01_FULL_44_40]|uniref:Large ribosomal subunit protein uL2 n=1 Tax=Candidatus Giovannonibacteria bacterium RIFCSPHIGHO2_01_FULL_45_23 TaxID=1798325 RepID=A0A1F5VIT6_9BACT|nr:MAG: 50S ribosomal protein L2 [Candidatus Giovannonibacteria bacterium RIFCSPHIGHO2_01_FULL_45_23]OGF76848.1 MAG: 50S ribosomal protein L2 [Candidatus Giovannonibacteria bacterium RIFCSPHIGHO2_02_FULL_45_13]OGF80332.1 MAG: 50S ribosomal protein L2 [Candidatus Giovannonibacteria bacterium RIFCSPLOWO2_01_FULL_44_40]